MKSSGVATSSQLPEHAPRKVELCLNYKMQKIVGHHRVVTRRGIHFEIRKRRTLDLYGVPSLTYSSKDYYHLKLRVVLANADFSARADN